MWFAWLHEHPHYGELSFVVFMDEMDFGVDLYRMIVVGTTVVILMGNCYFPVLQVAYFASSSPHFSGLSIPGADSSTLGHGRNRVTVASSSASSNGLAR